MKLGENREQYVLDKTLDKVLSIRTRLDRLMFILLAFSLFGIANFAPPKGKGFLSYIDIVIPETYFNLTIAGVLLGTFALIGSNLIDYIRKRFLVDKYAKIYLKEIDEGERSDVLVPASVYDFMYELDHTRNELRREASLALLFTFYFSHFVALIHINYVTENIWLKGAIYTGFILVYVLCYRTFIKAIPKKKRELKKVMKNSIFGLLGACVLLVFVLFVVFDPSL